MITSALNRLKLKTKQNEKTTCVYEHLKSGVYGGDDDDESFIVKIHLNVVPLLNIFKLNYITIDHRNNFRKTVTLFFPSFSLFDTQTAAQSYCNLNIIDLLCERK